MDGLGWDETQVVTNSSSPLWIHNSEENNILVSNNSNFCTYGGKMDLTTADIFNQIQELHKAPTSQTHEGITANWRNTSTHQEIYSSPLINNKACFGNMGSDHHHQPQGGINTKQDGVYVTASLESLDCLLSATTSNTDTSIEDDDGISMIFSDCRALWNNFTNTINNKNTSATTVSSGESENNITCNARNKETYDETASQSSSDQAKSLQPKSVVPTKRSYSFMEGGFRLISETNNPGGKSKRLKQEKRPSSSNINFQQPSSSFSSSIEEPDPEAIAQMKEMIYRAAAFRPVNLGLDVVERPKRKNVRISTDPQTVAARQRRERISERIRVLQRLVPGGSKMDTASMLDEAANYLKFLRSQVKALENLGQNHSSSPTNIAFSSLPFNHSIPMQHTQFPFLQNPNHLHLP